VAGYGSLRLVRMHDLLLGEVQLCMGQLQSQKLIRTQDINKQHQGVLDAIETRDVELAVFLIRRHIFHARDRLLTRFEE
jgi:DNA-binding GntR family transcriptional regulator